MLEFQDEVVPNTQSITIPIDIRILIWGYFDSIKDKRVKLPFKLFGIQFRPSFKVSELEPFLVKLIGPRI